MQPLIFEINYFSHGTPVNVKTNLGNPRFCVLTFQSSETYRTSSVCLLCPNNPDVILKMAQLSDDDIREILNAESESDISDLETDIISDNNESSSSDTESETNFLEDSFDDPQFISKNQMVWSATPLAQPIRTASENIIATKPGPTRYAVSRCEDILSSFTLFFPPALEKIIVENTNKYGRIKFANKWEDIDEDTLRAYIAVLILAGLFRYVFLYYLYILQ